jgi:hypothetical protein
LPGAEEVTVEHFAGDVEGHPEILPRTRGEVMRPRGLLRHLAARGALEREAGLRRGGVPWAELSHAELARFVLNHAA